MRSAIVIIFTLLWALHSSASAQNSVDENAIKAALVYNIVRFVEWRDSSVHENKAEFFICIYGSGASASAFGMLTGKSVGGRNITTVPMESLASQSTDCHVKFISGESTVTDDLNNLNAEGVLIVGEGRAALKNGAGLSLYRKGEKIAFGVNRSAVETANLSVSWKVLQLADQIQ